MRDRSRPAIAWTGVIALAVAAAGAGGCAGAGNSGTGPYQAQSESARDAGKAERLTREAAGLIESNPTKAEVLLREALTADIYHGPAHNNLGVVYLGKSPPMLYEAASEFEWARKLMPGHPDPRVNLAMTLEQAGRTRDALEAYETALEVYPNYLPAMQAIASMQMRGAAKPDERTKRFLSEIALRAPEAEWREWARAQLVEVESRREP
jgi:tetratricopeptide (TPR) repeat protein